MQGIDGDYFTLLGLERFWNEANLPQKLLKKSLDKRRGATLSDKPLALTLQRKNQKAHRSGTLEEGKFKNGNTEKWKSQKLKDGRIERLKNRKTERWINGEDDR